jgi:hypothetical protein
MMRKKIIPGLAFVVCAMCVSGCSPLPMWYLQYFSSFFTLGSGTVHIERGKKKRSFEIGGSFSQARWADSAISQKGESFNIAACKEDAITPNCHLRFPNRYLNVHATILSEKLVCGIVEVQAGVRDGTTAWNGSAGIGVRLFKKPLAGRIFVSVGQMTMFSKTEILVNDLSGAGYYLRDSYSEKKPYLAFTAALNSTHDDWIVNPVLNVNARWYSLFNYYRIRADQIELSVTGGISRNAGPLIIFTGGQLTGITGDRSGIPHARAVVQLTTSFGGT